MSTLAWRHDRSRMMEPAKSPMKTSLLHTAAARQRNMCKHPHSTREFRVCGLHHSTCRRMFLLRIEQLPSGSLSILTQCHGIRGRHHLPSLRSCMRPCHVVGHRRSIPDRRSVLPPSSSRQQKRTLISAWALKHPPKPITTPPRIIVRLRACTRDTRTVCLSTAAHHLCRPCHCSLSTMPAKSVSLRERSSKRKRAVSGCPRGDGQRTFQSAQSSKRIKQ